MGGGSDEPGTVISDFIATAIPGHKMDMRLTTSLGIRFAEGPAKGREPVRTLLDIHDHIAKAVVPALTPFL